MAENDGERVNILSVDLKKFELKGRTMDSLHKGALTHAPRAPKKSIVRRKPLSEALGIRNQRVALAVDSLQQRQRQPIDRCYRLKMPGFGVKHESLGGSEVRGLRAPRPEPLQRFGNSYHKPRNRLLKVHAGPVCNGVQAQYSRAQSRV